MAASSCVYLYQKIPPDFSHFNKAFPPPDSCKKYVLGSKFKKKKKHCLHQGNKLVHFTVRRLSIKTVWLQHKTENFKCVFLVKTWGPCQSKMLFDGQLGWKNLHVPQSRYIKHTVCKCRFLQQLEAIFFKICICLHDRESTIKEERRSRPCCAPARAGAEGCRCYLIWIRMLWLWGAEACWIRKEGTTSMQTEPLETGDCAESGTLARLTEIHSMEAMEKKHIQHLHMLFPSPLIRSSKRGRCPAQLHMKQCGRGAGLWQRRAISRIPINLWQPLQCWTLQFPASFSFWKRALLWCFFFSSSADSLPLTWEQNKPWPQVNLRCREGQTLSKLKWLCPPATTHLCLNVPPARLSWWKKAPHSLTLHTKA